MNPEIQATKTGPPQPVVSIVIPARNEERNLECCLRSLVVQRGISFEIIVVDDCSTDRTREIAKSFSRVKTCPVVGENSGLCAVKVISARSPLPENFTGKANACLTGAAQARGQLLLFTDADTEHFPGSLARAVSEANEHDCELLSYSPEQELTGFAQYALMPVIFGELAAVYRPSKVSDPHSPEAAANGQYLLIAQGAYQRIGGHAAVAASLLEDVDLARRVKATGAKIRFRLGRGIVRAHMYRDFSDLREGWTKNLALLFPNARTLAVVRSIEFAWIGLGLLAGIGLAGRHPGMVSVCIGFSILAWLNFLSRVRRAHFGVLPTLASIFGLPIFAWLLRRSAGSREVTWKGRQYDAGATSSAAGESNQSVAVRAGNQF